MRCRSARWHNLLAVLMASAVAGAPDAVCRAAAPGPVVLPPFDHVEKIVLGHFEQLADFKPGDIISRSQVEPLFPRLLRMGWAVSERKAILDRVPTDRDFLVKQLRTPSGRKFMRKIGGSPGAYDRLERLSELPRGRLAVRRLIQQPKGAGVINHFATAPKGKRVNQLMAKPSKGGIDYDKPTGQIYTVKMLLTELKECYPGPTRVEPAAKRRVPVRMNNPR
jgi:hypothetical protein